MFIVQATVLKFIDLLQDGSWQQIQISAQYLQNYTRQAKNPQ